MALGRLGSTVHIGLFERVRRRTNSRNFQGPTQPDEPGQPRPAFWSEHPSSTHLQFFAKVAEDPVFTTVYHACAQKTNFP